MSNKKRGRPKKTKTKRVNLIIYPDVYEKVVKICYMKRISPNELINKKLLNFVLSNKEELAEYEKIYGSKNEVKDGELPQTDHTITAFFKTLFNPKNKNKKGKNNEQ